MGMASAAADAIPILVARLYATSEELQHAAASALCNLLASAQSNTRAAVQAGAVAALGALACSPSSSLRLVALQALTNVFVYSGADEDQAAQLAAAGALHAAVEQLRGEDMPLQEAAARLLRSMSTHGGCHSWLVAQQAVGPLVQLLSTAINADVRSAAACTVVCLTTSNCSHSAVLDAGGAARLVQLLQHSDTQSLDARLAAVALAYLTASASSAVAAAGGLQPLVHWVFCSGNSGGSTFLSTAAGGLCSLAKEHGSLVVAAGGLAAVARLLSGSSDANSIAKLNAVRCLRNVAVSSPTSLDAKAAVDCTAALVAGAFGSNIDLNDKLSAAAVRALSAVWQSSAANQQAVQSTLDHLLRDSSSPQAQRANAAVLLCHLVSSELPAAR